jgi:hypothetical protein
MDRGMERRTEARGLCTPRRRTRGGPRAYTIAFLQVCLPATPRGQPSEGRWSGRADSPIEVPVTMPADKPIVIVPVCRGARGRPARARPASRPA